MSQDLTYKTFWRAQLIGEVTLGPLDMGYCDATLDVMDTLDAKKFMHISGTLNTRDVLNDPALGMLLTLTTEHDEQPLLAIVIGRVGDTLHVRLMMSREARAWATQNVGLNHRK